MHQTGTPDASAVLTVADGVARRAVALAAPVRFDLARSDDEREATFRLRYQTIAGRGWARPEDLPDGLERDAYDDLAAHVLGWDGHALTASARLVFPSPGYLLPTEAAFDVIVEPRGKVADMGRQIVARTHSDLHHRVFAGLLAACWLEARARGFSYVCGDFTPSMVRLYRRMGLRVTVLGPARQFWGESRQPILCDPGRDVSTLVQRWGFGPNGVF